MREDWELKKLGDVCEIKGRIGYRGYTKEDIVEKGDGAITLSPSNIVDDKLILKNCTYISWHKYEESPEIMIYNDDILFVKTGSSYGKVAIVEDLPEKATINPQSVVLKNVKCDNRFLYYQLISKKFKEQVENIVGGSSIPTLSQSNLAKTNIPVPPLTVQKGIVGILDEAFEAIDQAKANVERNIKNVEELFQSKLNEIFSRRGEGWQTMSLGELGKVSMCKRIYKKQTSEDGDVPFFKIGTFGKEPNAYIRKEVYQEYKEKYSFPNKGDILLSASGTIGRRVVYDGKPAYFQDSNIVWIANDEEFVINPFLYHFYSICVWNPSKGATISRLYNDDLRRISISFPSDKRKQLELVEIFEQVSLDTNKLVSVYYSKQNHLEELKMSILQKAFSGELTANETVVV